MATMQVYVVRSIRVERVEEDVPYDRHFIVYFGVILRC